MCLKQFNVNRLHKRSERAHLKLPSLASQQGNMTMMALFVIVVIGMLSMALIKIVSSASNTMLHQVYGLRAHQAAQVGVQSMLQSSFPVGGSANTCNQTITSPSSFSSVPGLTNCAFQASCETTNIQFANVDYLYYKFSSTGSCSVDTNVVSRTISVDAMQEVTP